MTHLKRSLRKDRAFESSCLLSVVVSGGHLRLLSSPRKGPAGPWTLGKLFFGPACVFLAQGLPGHPPAQSPAAGITRWC